MSSVSFCANNKIWSGDKHETIFNSNVSLGYLILNELNKTPERITQVSADTGVEVTCYEMRQRSIKMAKHLQSLGLKQGDIVGIVGSNSEYLVPIFIACFTLGLPTSPLAPGVTDSYIINIYSKTKPKIFFCDASVTHLVQSSVKEIGYDKPVIYTLVDKIEGFEFVENVIAASDNVDFTFPELLDIGNTTAAILCSSGTTGPAKGICKSHLQFIHQCFPMWELASEKQEVYFNFSTLDWISGIFFFVTATLYGGLRVITKQNFDPNLMVDICNRYRVTTILTAPMSFTKVVQLPGIKTFESVRVILTGGTTPSESLLKLLQPMVPQGKIFTIYGSSEGDFVAASLKQQRLRSCGFPAPNVQMKIIDDSGNHLGPNTKGEICYKTKILFSGYFGEPEKSAKTLVDGWVVSDDMGYFDDDGFLFFIDRKEDVLKYNNCRVYPSEVEKIINGIEGVNTSCVVGVKQDSDTKTDILFAFIEKNADKNLDLNAFEIEKLVNKRTNYPLKGGVHFIDHMPLTLTGKTIRRDVRKIATEIYKSSVTNQ